LGLGCCFSLLKNSGYDAFSRMILGGSASDLKGGLVGDPSMAVWYNRRVAPVIQHGAATGWRDVTRKSYSGAVALLKPRYELNSNIGAGNWLWMIF
jgi:hypothetical protein